MLRFVLCLIYALVARQVAERSARGFVSQDWVPLVASAMLVFLLLMGFAGLGFLLDAEHDPIAAQGLPARKGWVRETGLGVAIGWGIALVCVLPMIAFGGIAIHFSFNAASLGWLAADAAYFALSTLAAQIVLRGYPFQLAIRAFGEMAAALLLSVIYGIDSYLQFGANHASMVVSIVLGLLLSMAYLRTRALWLAWGIQFGWVASRALLFGLPVNGVSSHSPVVQGYPMTAYGVGGGDFGLDASWLAFVVILLAMPVVYRATRELSFLHNAPVLEPAGLAVDLDAAARRQHEVATRPEVPEVKPLVQILPVASAAPTLAPDLDRTREAE